MVYKFLNQWRLKYRLIAYLNEMEKNLELFYVMDQRQFITHGFTIEVWERVKNDEIIKKHNDIVACVQAMTDFNQQFKNYKDYEQWYVGDVNNKTPDNAKKLHAMKNDLDQKLKGMDALIIPAGQTLEKEMIALGFLKY